MDTISSTINLKTAELTGLDISLFKKNRMNFFINLASRHTSMEKQSIIVMQGGSGLPRYDTDVQTFHFIQESNFYYLTGVREADFYSILDVINQELHLFYKLPSFIIMHSFLSYNLLFSLIMIVLIRLISLRYSITYFVLLYKLILIVLFFLFLSIFI